ncbi:FAD-dependent oxidoreductase [Pseudomonas aeruginosa]|uniref:FAD-dependent oxidoreductase n=1 Tax=Pseudomonas aeruginosa TaxID=287 RepID=UPI001C975F0C|nr:FAD-dependent oxidoreductase [Pseudomonas aeruginosa]WAJ81430.1 FAD-dependent oxidoreductase [Pseudomonas aeruginosa]HBO1414547.1 FAD-dependent oxidoreductase [Pseudomonas aeruginosa]HBO3807448.1 FAD-dependent oxidoreductase [Pseudomonas aeruginosa]HBO7425083.1 FAD-dependent oxidoreductase [Pseudomonas aeruginosa]HCL3529990.1 FAD-dependent oxidoreductase [Pseudomonas aeruginosa]
MSREFDLLLAGAGHAHLGVLRRWLSEPRPPGRIALISDGPYAWYSGMLPGLLAGRYLANQCRIPLQPLSAGADVELLQGRLVGLAPDSNTLTLSDGRQLSAAWLSINLGSQPKPPTVRDCQLDLLPVKPFEAFLTGWQEWCKSPQPLAILGGGAAGVELALALAPQVPALTLISAATILAGHPPALRERAVRRLAQAGVTVREGAVVESIHGHDLMIGRRSIWHGRRVIVATGASPLPWLCAAGLACDEQGFIRVSDTLQSLSHPHILVAGDCASLVNTPRSGVYAVRQGPILAANLAAALNGLPLSSFVPQRRALALLADGHGGALMSWAGMTAEGGLLGWWKDRLDRRFIRRHLAKP